MTCHRPRVLQLIGGFTSGGAEIVLVNLVNALTEDGEFEVVVSAREGGPLTQLISPTVPVTLIPKRRTVDLRYLVRLVSLLRKERIQLVHSHMFGNNLYGFLAASIAEIPIVQTLHGMDELRSSLRILAYRRMARRVPWFVSVSQSLSVRFLEAVPAARSKMRRIYNGIPMPRPRTPAEVAAKRRELGLPAEARVVGCIGNVKPIKGYEILFQAAAEILAKQPQTVFLIAGLFSESSPYEKGLLPLLDELGIRDQVKFLGFRKDIPDLLALMDVFVLPSMMEGHPIALLEAMAMGRPVIATAAGGIPEVIRSGETGLLVPSRDPAALRDAILFLLDDQARAAELGTNGQAVVQREFSVARMVKAYTTLYHQTLGLARE